MFFNSPASCTNQAGGVSSPSCLASSGFAEETAFWAAARAIAESLPDGNRERTMLVNLLGGREQVVAAAREAQPSEAMRLFDEAGR